MTTLILEAAGSVGGAALGGPIGAAVGRAFGAAAGSLIDGTIFGGSSGPRYVEGPRLTDVAGLTSTEGEPIPRVYGRARIGGTLIWATRPLEVATTTTEEGESGGKGGIGGASAGDETVTTAYAYYANLAVGLCQGTIAGIRRVWADGNEIDLTEVTMRVHKGATGQAPDPLIVAKEGADAAPAYRGLAYVVFERLPLANFGNRVPQLVFEVLRPVDGIGEQIRGVCLIPGSTEFGLDPRPVTEDAGYGATKPGNRFQLLGTTDVDASLDALQALCPNVDKVSVVVSWFGDDLRAGTCTVRPRTDGASKVTFGEPWSVAGLTRDAVPLVSSSGGGPAYGGTPSDAGLGRLVAELQRRGFRVVLYPFVMMDVPDGNARPDPRNPGAAQPPYPWRGRITCHPAPGLSGSPDGTAAAAAQVAAFFDGADGYRAFILHYANLAAAWGLSGFIVGSEFVGLTRVRGPSNSYPAVEKFRQLAGEVRAILGAGVDLVYAADWTEYGAHVRGGTVRFPLDALFSDPAIDAVGIDYYPPLSDWRDGDAHADAALACDVYDRAYLKNGLGAGEAFDWYYADESDRRMQARTPITDGACQKPWIYRAKDLVAWWSHAHVERDGGVETHATAWHPQGKPIWLTEIGVPAVDRGTNGPNVFPDPKSSENAVPPFSRGTRDDLIQARGLEAILRRFDATLSGFDAQDNPVSSVTGARMVDRSSVFVWCWDARPFPAFPDLGEVWSDAGNWELGHWLNGRVEGQELDRLVSAILRDYGIDASVGASLRIAANGFLDGFVIDRPLSARGVLEPLAQAFGLDIGVSGGILRIRGPGVARPVALSGDDLVLVKDEAAPLSRVRAQESELPRVVEIGFSDGESPEYRRATASALRPAGDRRRAMRIETAFVTRRAAAEALAEAVLDETLAARETARFALSPRRIELEPGDLVVLPDGFGGGRHRIARIGDAPDARRVETCGVSESVRDGPSAAGATARPRRPRPSLPGPPFAVPLDLPIVRDPPAPLQYLAVTAQPWPGKVAIWRSAGGGAPFKRIRTLDRPAVLGRTLTDLPPGPLWRFDRVARLDAMLPRAGGLHSADEMEMLAGRNLFALVAPDGGVEILSAARAVLTDTDTYRLSTLLRGLYGSEPMAGRTAPAGSLIVRLDGAGVAPLVYRLDEAGIAYSYRVGPAKRDPADPTYAGFEASAGLSPLVPLAPVHLRARREAGGVRFTWIRRGRRDADAWGTTEIPMAEEEEAYQLDILGADGHALRTLSASRPNALYTTAAETADFGGPQAVIGAQVAQWSTVAGPGAPRLAQVPVLPG